MHSIGLYGEIGSCTISLCFSAFSLPRKALQTFSNASQALLSVAFNFAVSCGFQIVV
jgi:hypothetical protein